MKRNKYIFLTILCISLVIFIQSTITPAASSKQEIKFDINKEKLLTSPYAPIFTILSLIYLIALLIGIANLIIFGIRKFRKNPVSGINEVKQKIHLSENTTSKLLFFISLLVLSTYLVPFFMHTFRYYLSINFFLLLNIMLQVGTTVMILRYIKTKYLIFSLNKKHFYFLIRIYTAVLPVILAAALLNSLIVKQLGITASNPMKELLFLLDSKISIFILSIQAILLAPIAEELFFRGFIYKLIRNRYSFLISSTLISLFFALIHRTPQNILPLFVISMGLCYVYEKTQNILVPIIFHSLHNSISLLFFLIIKNLL